MSKRNAALEAVGAIVAPSKAESPAAALEAVPVASEPAKRVADGKEKVARVMLYLHPKVAKKVKEIALHQNRKAHDIYLDALEAYMRSQGFGTLTDISVR